MAEQKREGSMRKQAPTISIHPSKVSASIKYQSRIRRLSEQKNTATAGTSDGKKIILNQINLLVEVNQTLFNNMKNTMPFDIHTACIIASNARTISDLINSLGPSF